MKNNLLLLGLFTISSLASANDTFIGANLNLTTGFTDSTTTLVDALVYDFGASYARAEQDTVGFGGGLVVGTWFNDVIGFEAGYNSLGKVEGSSTSSISLVSPLTYSYGAAALHLALLAGGKIKNDRLYARIGVYNAQTTSEWAIPSRSESGTTSSSGALIGVGYDHLFTDHWAGRLQANLYNRVEFQEIVYGYKEREDLFSISYGMNYNF